jgi:hypothetical protein
MVACHDAAPTAPAVPTQPRAIINGVDDDDHAAVAAIMIYSPGAFQGDWYPTCSGALVHKHVITTVGHCIHGIQARLASGNVRAVWVSFQQDPTAHFNADPALEDPAAAGWYEVESVHDDPDMTHRVPRRAAPASATPVVRSSWPNGTRRSARSWRWSGITRIHSPSRVPTPTSTTGPTPSLTSASSTESSTRCVQARIQGVMQLGGEHGVSGPHP